MLSVKCVHVVTGAVLRSKSVPTMERVYRVIERAIEKAQVFAPRLTADDVDVFVVEKDEFGMITGDWAFNAAYALEARDLVSEADAVASKKLRQVAA